MKTTAEQSEKFWHLAAMKMCALRGIDPLQRIRVKQEDGKAVAQSTTVYATTLRELKGFYQIAEAFYYAEEVEDMLAMVGKTAYLLRDVPLEDPQKVAEEGRELMAGIPVGSKFTIIGVEEAELLFIVEAANGSIFKFKDADLGEHDPREYDLQ